MVGNEELSTAKQTTISLSGKIYPVQQIDKNWYLGNARVVKDAIIARNGIIYMIDTVLE